MKKHAFVFLFVIVTMTAFSVLAEEDGASSARTWTSASGAQMTAAFDKLIGDTVVLNKPNGGRIKIRMNQLSAADQVYARSQSTGIPAPAGKVQDAEIPPELEELFGKKLINAKKKRFSPAELSGKTIGIYFSAHWCPPCRKFTPELVKFYNQLKADGKDFEIVFASSDKDSGSMISYMKEMKMPWLALKFGDKHVKALKGKFKVQGIPMLVIIDDKGNTISDKARSEVTSKGAAAFDKWAAKSTATKEL